MLHQTSLLRLRHFYMFIQMWPKNYNQFIFDEDTNDVISVYGVPYEQQQFENATGRQISIVTSGSVETSMMYLIVLLQQMINFRIKQTYGEGIDSHKYVFVGIFDISLVTYSYTLACESLFPTSYISYRLLVVNMEMVGTPTFFVDLFDIYLWIAFLVSFTLIGFVSTLGIYLLQRYTNQQFDYLTWFSMLTNQGGEYKCSHAFPKVLVIIVSIIAIIFHGSFGAFLSSHLAVRHPDIPFKTLDGLLESREYTICVAPITSPYYFIVQHWKTNLNQPTVHSRLNNEKCPEQFKTNSLPNYQVTDFCPMDKTVYFVPTLRVDTSDCPTFNMIELEEKYFKQYITVLTSPGFKYREQFNRGLIRIRTAGFINQFNLRIKKSLNKDESRLKQLDNDVAIHFHQTKIILLIEVVGIVLAFIILLFEVVNKN